MPPRAFKLILLLLELFLSVALMSQAGAADIVVKRFAGGSGQNAVGIVEASQDTEIDGPQALTTDENGEIYLLDQVTGRIIGFDPKNSVGRPRILGLPDQLQPTDLIVRKSDILVWDGAMHTLQSPSGTTTRHFGGWKKSIPARRMMKQLYRRLRKWAR